MDIKALLTAEESAINSMFRQNNIYAKVDRSQSIYKEPTAGFIRYALKLRPDQRFKRIEDIQRELSAVLTNQRRAWQLGKVKAMPVSTPVFGIEVQHPFPEMLNWSPRLLDSTPAHAMSLGRSYEQGAATEILSLDDSPHILVAGMTGAGKSVLLQNMALSFMYATDPAGIRFIIIDLKNEDMLPFKPLPWVTFCGKRAEAMAMIQLAVEEKDKRVDNPDYRPYRLIVWIDELAQLADNKEAIRALGDLASIGRSKQINLVGATQHPTEDGGMGSMMSANFTTRLVGMVAPGQSYAATRRKEMHADLLPGKGAFLRIEGPNAVRFQSFNLDKPSLQFGIERIMTQWLRPITVQEPAPMRTPATVQPAVRRDPLDELADQVGPLWEAETPKRQIARMVLQKEYVGSYAAKVDAAIKRWRERKAATASATAPATSAATAPLLTPVSTGNGETVASSSSSDEKIIRFPKRVANG